jgi:hypothetical protein
VYIEYFKAGVIVMILKNIFAEKFGEKMAFFIQQNVSLRQN